MRNLETLINRKKSMSKDSPITQEEINIIWQAIQDHAKEKPLDIDWSQPNTILKESITNNGQCYERERTLRCALDLH